MNYINHKRFVQHQKTNSSCLPSNKKYFLKFGNIMNCHIDLFEYWNKNKINKTIIINQKNFHSLDNNPLKIQKIKPKLEISKSSSYIPNLKYFKKASTKSVQAEKEKSKQFQKNNFPKGKILQIPINENNYTSIAKKCLNSHYLKRANCKTRKNKFCLSDYLQLASNNQQPFKPKIYKKPSLHIPFSTRIKQKEINSNTTDANHIKSLTNIEDTTLLSEGNIQMKEIEENVSEIKKMKYQNSAANMFQILNKQPLINKVFNFQRNNIDVNKKIKIDTIIKDNIEYFQRTENKNGIKKSNGRQKTPILNKYINKTKQTEKTKTCDVSKESSILCDSSSSNELTETDDIEKDSHLSEINAIKTYHNFFGDTTYSANTTKENLNEESIIEKKDLKKVPIFKTNRLIQECNTKHNIISKNQNDIILSSISLFLDKKSFNNLILSNSKILQIIKRGIFHIIMNSIMKNKKELILNIRNYVFKYSKLYTNKTLLKKTYLEYTFTKSKYVDDIKKDLLRTFPDDSTFHNGKKNYVKLHNILNAYANYNNEIGYAQGLNFLVGHLIFSFDEEEKVFLFIDGIIRKFKLKNLIGVSNSLSEKMGELENLLNNYVPKVMRYLDKNGLNHEFFTANWVVTLFSNSMKTKYFLTFLNLMIIFDWNFFNFFVVAILQTYSNKIIYSDQNALVNLMKTMLKTTIFESNFKNIIKKAIDLLVDNCTYNSNALYSFFQFL